MSEISDTNAATPLLLKPNGVPVFQNIGNSILLR
jgi:hypothetical protein